MPSLHLFTKIAFKTLTAACASDLFASKMTLLSSCTMLVDNTKLQTNSEEQIPCRRFKMERKNVPETTFVPSANKKKKILYVLQLESMSL